MSKYHVQEIFKQFPWLKDHFPNGEQIFVDAKVGKFNFEFLSREAGYWDAGMSGIRKIQIYLFDGDGKLLGNVHKRRTLMSLFMEGIWMRSVREALTVLGPEAVEVRFAVEVAWDTITVYPPLLHYPPSNLLAMELKHREEVRQKWLEENAAKV